MQVKRSRVPSFGDAGVEGVLNQSSSTPPPSEPGRHPRTDPKIAPPPPSLEGGQFRPGILMVSSPEVVVKQSGRDDGHYHEQIGSFLEKCYFCKKRMRQQDEVFMYGTLHAFCTPQCRNRQIVVDKVVERVIKQPRGTGNGRSNGMNDVKDQSGFQLANCVSFYSR